MACLTVSKYTQSLVGRDSSVGIATRYELNGCLLTYESI
jgi:hypothetical protein